MARIGMSTFIQLSGSIKKLSKEVHAARETKKEVVTVPVNDLERLVDTFKGFEIQILNSR